MPNKDWVIASAEKMADLKRQREQAQRQLDIAMQALSDYKKISGVRRRDIAMASLAAYQCKERLDALAAQGDRHATAMDSSNGTASRPEGLLLDLQPNLPAAEPPDARGEVRPERRVLVHGLAGDALDGAAADSGWVSILERLPAVGAEVLLWVQANPDAVERAHDEDCTPPRAEVHMGECRNLGTGPFLDDYAGSDNHYVTHWMPLPMPPQAMQGNWQTAFMEERKKFQQESIRASMLTMLINKIVHTHGAKHNFHAPRNECELCALMRDAESLLNRSVVTLGGGRPGDHNGTAGVQVSEKGLTE